MDRNQIKSKARGTGVIETPKKATKKKPAPKATTPKAKKVVLAPPQAPADQDGPQE
jgi:hypothetical protein